MRFVSHIRGFSVQIEEPAVRFTNYGDRIVDREGYVAQFGQTDVTNDDVDALEREFGGVFHGRTTEMDEVTLVPLLSRVSTFDTDEKAIEENWDPAFKQKVEEKLLARSDRHPDFRQVREAPVPAPWPKYREFYGPIEDLLAKIVEDGHDPRRVLAFERQNDNRDMVTNALVKLIAEQDAQLQGAEVVPA